jgi:hypothetical protein
MPFQYRAIAPTVTMSAPTLNNAGNTEFAGNPATDINGNYTLGFASTGANAPAKLRLEESNNNGASWALLADVPSSQTTYDINGRGNGTFQYRVSGLYAVENGLFSGPASAVKTVTVDRRMEADVTSIMEARIMSGSVSYGDVFQFDQVLRNSSSSTSVFAPLKFVITSVTGSVRVNNADNGGDGVSSPATFDYTSQVGADQQLSPSESTASRHLEFRNPNSEMFTFTIVVVGNLPDPAGASSGGGAAAGGAGSGGTGGAGGAGSSGSSSSSGLSMPAGKVIKITVNPLTKSVTVKLL